MPAGSNTWTSPWWLRQPIVWSTRWPLVDTTTAGPATPAARGSSSAAVLPAWAGPTTSRLCRSSRPSLRGPLVPTFSRAASRRPTTSRRCSRVVAQSSPASPRWDRATSQAASPHSARSRANVIHHATGPGTGVPALTGAQAAPGSSSVVGSSTRIRPTSAARYCGHPPFTSRADRCPVASGTATTGTATTTAARSSTSSICSNDCPPPEPPPNPPPPPPGAPWRLRWRAARSRLISRFLRSRSQRVSRFCFSYANLRSRVLRPTSSRQRCTRCSKPSPDATPGGCGRAGAGARSADSSRGARRPVARYSDQFGHD